MAANLFPLTSAKNNNNNNSKQWYYNGIIKCKVVHYVQMLHSTDIIYLYVANLPNFAMCKLCFFLTVV